MRKERVTGAWGYLGWSSFHTEPARALERGGSGPATRGARGEMADQIAYERRVCAPLLARHTNKSARPTSLRRRARLVTRGHRRGRVAGCALEARGRAHARRRSRCGAVRALAPPVHSSSHLSALASRRARHRRLPTAQSAAHPRAPRRPRCSRLPLEVVEQVSNRRSAASAARRGAAAPPPPASAAPPPAPPARRRRLGFQRYVPPGASCGGAARGARRILEAGAKPHGRAERVAAARAQPATPPRRAAEVDAPPLERGRVGGAPPRRPRLGGRAVGGRRVLRVSAAAAAASSASALAAAPPPADRCTGRRRGRGAAAARGRRDGKLDDTRSPPARRLLGACAAPPSSSSACARSSACRPGTTRRSTAAGASAAVANAPTARTPTSRRDAGRPRVPRSLAQTPRATRYSVRARRAELAAPCSPRYISTWPPRRSERA